METCSSLINGNEVTTHFECNDGSVGNKNFEFFSIDNAEAITITGQAAILYVEKRINEYLSSLLKLENVENFVIYIDTDSVYLSLDKLISKMFTNESDSLKITEFISKFCEQKLSKIIEKACSDFGDLMNSREKVLEMNREHIADSGVWTGKKHYALNVLDSEGFVYPTGNMKVTGIEIVRSSTPKVCRDALKTALNILLTGTNQEYIDFVAKFRKEFFEYSPEIIANPTGVSGIEKYSDEFGNYTLGSPQHVKAAIIFNKKTKQLTIETKYGIIHDNDKIKVLPLIEPNPVGDSVIGFKTILPKEFGLDNYIDYEAQYFKFFLNPISKIAELIGWTHVDNTRVTKFFG